jgi:hypothetical protein
MNDTGIATMSGIVSGIDYSLLFGTQSSANTGAAILSTLYSGTSASSLPPTTFVSSGNSVTDLALAQQEQARGVAQEAKQPQVVNDITAFKTAVSNSKTIQDALANPAIQKVLLTANGLSSYIGETALVQKLFLSDASDPDSLVQKFSNAAWLNTVHNYNFAQNGLAELQDPKTIAALSNSYAEMQWRLSLNQATPGLANALTFLGQASSIKSVNDILGNMTNFEVITTALGIPQQIVNQSTTGMENAITSRLDFSKLQDRQYVTSLTDRYLLTMQENNSSSSSGGTSLATLAAQTTSLLL